MGEATGAFSLLSTLILGGFGQSALSVVSMAVIGKWFSRRLGLAMGAFAVLLDVWIHRQRARHGRGRRTTRLARRGMESAMCSCACAGFLAVHA